jgi:hypothetical protein
MPICSRSASFRLAPAARHLPHAEEDDHGQENSQTPGDVEDAPPADDVPEHQRQDHPQEVTDGTGQLENAVDPPPHPGAEVVGDEAVEARVGGVVNAGGGAGDQEGPVVGGDGVQPGGGAPDEGRQRQQFGAGVPVVEIAPDGVEDGADNQRAGGDGAHLRLGDTEGPHDGLGEGADEEFIGLMEEHEHEEYGDDEPGIARRSGHGCLLTGRKVEGSQVAGRRAQHRPPGLQRRLDSLRRVAQAAGPAAQA